MHSTSLREVRRLGVLGGTFDPPHNGHIATALAAADQLNLETVLLVPARDPWQKSGSLATSARHRFAMTALAAQQDRRLRASDVDLRRTGPTYTIDTLAALHEENPEHELVFILGADALAGIRTWHRWAEITDFAVLACVSRPSAALPDPSATDLDPRRLVMVEADTPDISSTRCRTGVYRNLVPADVADYIDRHDLY